MNNSRLILLFLFFLYFCACRNFHTIMNEEGIFIFEEEDTVLFYQVQTKNLNGKHPRANYIHPLYNLDGNVITEDFPDDHLHHRGIFWTWHQLWIGSKRIADPWLTRDLLWDVYEINTTKEKEKTILLNSKTHWKSANYTNESESMQPIIREEATIKVFPATKKYRVIDFNLKFYALVDSVMIGGSEDIKGYGGFSVRVKLNKNFVFTGENGVVEPQNLAVEAGTWIDISGNHPESNWGITIMDHPDNPGYPQNWILRRSNSMQNPKFPGQNPVSIPKDQPLLLKYRMVIHTGDLDREFISFLSDNFQSGI